MIEQAFKGRRNYRIWSLALLVVAAGGVYASALQSADGFVHTGMGNNAIWGLYHAQLPFLASIAAASLAILVPGTLQKHSFLASLAPLAAFLGATASAMSLLFIAAELLDEFTPGQLVELVPRLRALAQGRGLVLEASGVQPEQIQAYAASGIDLISTSAPVTRSRWLDLSMRFEPVAS